MQIVRMPVAGAAVTFVQIDGATLIVDGKPFDLTALPTSGQVRIEGDVCLVEYGNDGGVIAGGQFGDDYGMTVIPRDASDDPPAPEPAPEPPATEAEILAAMRPSMTAYRWQFMAVLGEDNWRKIQAFGADPATRGGAAGGHCERASHRAPV